MKTKSGADILAEEALDAGVKEVLECIPKLNKRGYPLKREISVKRHVRWRENNRQTCGNSNEARIFSLGIQTPDEANTNVLFFFEHCLPKTRVFAYTELRGDYRGKAFETLHFPSYR